MAVVLIAKSAVTAKLAPLGRIMNLCPNRGLTEENTQLGIISRIGYFKSPIGDIFQLGMGVLFSDSALPDSYIPNWIYYLHLGISDPRLGIIWPIGDIVC